MIDGIAMGATGLVVPWLKWSSLDVMRWTLVILFILLLAPPSWCQEIRLSPKRVKTGVETEGVRSVTWKHFARRDGRSADIVQYFLSDGHEYGGRSATRSFVETPDGHLAVIDRWYENARHYGVKFEDIDSGWWASWRRDFKVHGQSDRSEQARHEFMVTLLDLEEAMADGRVRSDQVFETSDGMRFDKVEETPADFVHERSKATFTAFTSWLSADRRSIWPPVPASAVNELEFLSLAFADGRNHPAVAPEVEVSRMALAAAAKVNSGEGYKSVPTPANRRSRTAEASGQDEVEYHVLYVAAKSRVIQAGDAGAFIKRFGQPYDADPWHGLEERVETGKP